MNNESTTFHARDGSERAYATHIFCSNIIELIFFLPTESLLIRFQRIMLQVLSKQQISWYICLICIYLMAISTRANSIYTIHMVLHSIWSNRQRACTCLCWPLFLSLFFILVIYHAAGKGSELFNLAVNLNCLYISDSVIRRHIAPSVCKRKQHSKPVKQ